MTKIKSLVISIFLTCLVSRTAQATPLPIPIIPSNTITVGYESTNMVVIPQNAEDSQPFIKKAIDDLATLGGGTVHIGPGVFICKAQIITGANIHLKGSGMDITTLKLADFAAPWKVGRRSMAGFVRSRLVDDQMVSHITLDGNKQNQKLADNYGRFGTFTEGSKRVLYDFVKVKNWQGYGFDPHGWKRAPGGALYGESLTVTNCVAENNDWDGFTLDQHVGIYVNNNTAIGNGRHGFNIVTGARNSAVYNSIAINNGYYDPFGGSGCGFMIQNNMKYGTRDAVFKNNYVKYAKKGGFCTNDVINVTFTNNVVVSAGACVVLNATTDGTFVNNTCFNITRINPINVVGGTNIVSTPNQFVTVEPEPPSRIPVVPPPDENAPRPPPGDPSDDEADTDTDPTNPLPSLPPSPEPVPSPPPPPPPPPQSPEPVPSPLPPPPAPPSPSPSQPSNPPDFAIQNSAGSVTQSVSSILMAFVGALMLVAML
jgi:Pectate lyase superfamily protein